jgi:hypothetical protein
MIFKNNSLYFLIPGNNELKELLLQKYGNAVLEIIDLYYYPLDKLYTNQFEDKTAARNSFISLHSQILRSILHPKFATRIIRDLIEFNYIERLESYQVGVESKKYRLHPSIDKLIFTESEVTNKALVKRLRSFKRKRESECSDNVKNISTSFGNKIYDSEAVKKFVQDFVVTDKNKDEVKVKESMLYMFEKLKEHNFDISQSSKSGRFFNTITNIKKELRQFILDEDGNKHAEVDLSNAQPLFLAMLYQIWKEMFPKENDIDSLYLQLTQEGKLNEYIIENFYQDDINKIGYDDTRKKVKLQILQYFFTSNDVKYTLPIENIFNQIFPNIAAFIRLYKGLHGNSDFSTTLQNMEAQMMLDDIAPQLLAKNISLIPIHDSFMISSKYVNTVKNTISEEFQRQFHITPALKVKY